MNDKDKAEIQHRIFVLGVDLRKIENNEALLYNFSQKVCIDAIKDKIALYKSALGD